MQLSRVEPSLTLYVKSMVFVVVFVVLSGGASMFMVGFVMSPSMLMFLVSVFPMLVRLSVQVMLQI